MKLYVYAGHRLPEDILALAMMAEELGVDGLSFPDHLMIPQGQLRSAYPYSTDGKIPTTTSPWLDPWVMIGAAGTVTTNLRFVTGVFILPLRHPLAVARGVATADALAPGRVELGVGVGWMREEFDVLGVDFAKRGALTDESIVVLRKLWQGGNVAHGGEHYSFEEIEFEPHPAQPVPILIGGSSPAAMRRAARLGDGYLAPPGPAAAAFDQMEQLGRLRKEAGRDHLPFAFRARPSQLPTADECRAFRDVGVDGIGITPPMVPAAELRPFLETFVEQVFSAA